MNGQTMTFTARSSKNPDRIATFTLQNGHVSVQLGTAMLEQVERVLDALDGEADSRLTGWIEPAATGALQKVLQPIPLTDFDANIEGESMRTMAWLRVGGLRLAPLVATWERVDNPAGARAFVNAVRERREKLAENAGLPMLFDYWISWVVTGLLSLTLPFLWWQWWRKHRGARSS
jgi:hypothetical protein